MPQELLLGTRVGQDFTYSRPMHYTRIINNDIQPAEFLHTRGDCALPVFAFGRVA